MAADLRLWAGAAVRLAAAGVHAHSGYPLVPLPRAAAGCALDPHNQPVCCGPAADSGLQSSAHRPGPALCQQTGVLGHRCGCAVCTLRKGRVTVHPHVAAVALHSFPKRPTVTASDGHSHQRCAPSQAPRSTPPLWTCGPWAASWRSCSAKRCAPTIVDSVLQVTSASRFTQEEMPVYESTSCYLRVPNNFLTYRSVAGEQYKQTTAPV